MTKLNLKCAKCPNEATFFNGKTSARSGMDMGNENSRVQ